MYCPECRATGSVPWAHEADCSVGLKQRLRWYEHGFLALLMVLVVETVLLIAAFTQLGRVP